MARQRAMNARNLAISLIIQNVFCGFIMQTDTITVLKQNISAVTVA